jgi:DNA-binding NtrC family response regulator
MKLRLLIVDDDAAILEMLGEYFLGRGHDVSVAPDVSAGVAHLTSGTFDAVVADLKFSDGEGQTLIRVASRRGVPLLVASGHAVAEDASAALRPFELGGGGALDFVVKPFRLRDLHDRLVKAVEVFRIRQQERAAAISAEILERAALAGSVEEAEALVPLLLRTIPRFPCCQRVGIGLVAVGEGLPLGAGRALKVQPHSAQVEPCVRAVDAALRRFGK